MVERHLPETTAFQTGNKNLNLLIVAKLLDDLGAVLEGGITSKVEEAPVLALADTADDTGKKTELHVNNNLLFVSLNVPNLLAHLK